ncbi:MAG: 1-deoxy-D-xylulose-5-phosphate reductoisomerase [Oligoflexia bacterium]|nr:1-deoxy-D-xylulose-5-phosphate reductoisomerase [Oligoflexia bacterium]
MKISILGCTGSIGESTLEVVRKSKGFIKIASLAAHSNAEKLSRHASEFGVSKTVLTSQTKNPEALEELATDPEIKTVVMAIVGFAALKPTIAALKAGKTVALANKEALVTCGELLTALAEKHGGKIIPVDSEHNALFQALQGHSIEQVDKLIITGSGGPFRGKTRSELQSVTIAQALNHPKWKMGPKITIDSATLMNKGLEYIEARWVFGLPDDKLKILIHPQSLVHGIVQFIDGSMLAHLSPPDMKAAISYALYYPQRQPGAVEPLDLVKAQKLEFFEVDYENFPCVNLAQKALKKGGVAPTVLNAANETAVQAFLDEKISFLSISDMIEKTLESAPRQNLDIQSIFAADAWARQKCQENILSLRH